MRNAHVNRMDPKWMEVYALQVQISVLWLQPYNLLLLALLLGWRHLESKDNKTIATASTAANSGNYTWPLFELGSHRLHSLPRKHMPFTMNEPKLLRTEFCLVFLFHYIFIRFFSLILKSNATTWWIFHLRFKTTIIKSLSHIRSKWTRTHTHPCWSFVVFKLLFLSIRPVSTQSKCNSL